MTETTKYEVRSANVRRSAFGVRRSVGRRLLHDTNGQVLLLGVVVIIALLAFMLVIPNGTHVAIQKMRAQTAADAGAFTGSVWLARALNLSANMNVGIKSMYTWMTVLTMAEALAQALYSDTLDASVTAMGQEMTLALFGNSDPVYTSSQIYPQSIQKLAETAQWLYDLQGDIAGSFPAVAQTLGSDQARRNASGGNPLSQNPGGMVLVRTEDTIPLFVENPSGDSLLYSDLLQLAASLESIPTNDSNIGPATGVILIDSHDFEIKAYYGSKSNWLALKQLLIGTFGVTQWYDRLVQKPLPGIAPESTRRFFNEHKPAQYLPYCGYSVTGQLTKWIDTTKKSWYAYGKQGYATPRPGDTVEMHTRHWKLATDPTWPSDTGTNPACTIPAAYPYINSGYEIIWSGPDPYDTDFYTGAESTRGNQGTRLRPRRLNPDRELHAVSYVWRLGADQTPRGLGPAIGKSLFPRSRVAAPCPMLTVARSEPYLARDNPTEEDYFFAPDWDVRLTPLDSAGVQDICNDTAYSSHSLNSINLEDLRRYVLLP